MLRRPLPVVRRAITHPLLIIAAALALVIGIAAATSPAHSATLPPSVQSAP